jgi:hypothetical protein
LDKEKLPEGQRLRVAVLVLISAATALFLLEMGGIFSFFFPVPLGVMLFAYKTRLALFAAFIVLAAHGITLAVFSFLSGSPTLDPSFVWAWGSTVALVLLWIWSVSPVPFIGRLSGATRLILGASVMFAFIVFGIGITGGFDFSTIYRDFSTRMEDAVSTAVAAYLEYGGHALDGIDASRITEMVFAFLSCGGGLACIALFFFVNRQISAALASLFNPSRKTASITDFYTDRRLVWALSFSLLAVASFRQFSVFTVIAWNVVTICAILYLAQGVAIVFYFLSKSPRTAATRLIHSLLMAVILITPVINMVVCCGVLVLGVAENWVPFRNQDIDGSSSTPVA